MKKFTMNVASRLVVLMNLPEQGSVVEMISKRNIQTKVNFSSEEMSEIKLSNEDGRISWANNINKDVRFSDDEIKLLSRIIKDLDEKGAVNDGILDFAAGILKEVNKDAK